MKNAAPMPLEIAWQVNELWDDYRRISFYGISVAFGAAMLVERVHGHRKDDKPGCQSERECPT